MARYVMTRLSTIALIFGLTTFSTGCGISSASPPPTGQNSNHTHRLHQGHNYHYTLENVLIEDNAIDIVVAPHGNMATEFVDPYITHTIPKQFVVTFKNMSPGKVKTNKKIVLSKNNFATSVKWIGHGNSLQMILFLKPKIGSFDFGGSGGFMMVFSFHHTS
ncbi:MAG: hypothetical protein ACYCYO_11075 [Bacilli bacterium]